MIHGAACYYSCHHYRHFSLIISHYCALSKNFYACYVVGLKRGVGRQNATTGKGSNHAETRVQQEGRTVEVEYRGRIQNRNG